MTRAASHPTKGSGAALRAPRRQHDAIANVARLLEAAPAGTPLTVRHDGASVDLPPALVAGLRLLAQALQTGEPVTITAGSTAGSPDEDPVLSSQDVADLLNVSRPYVVKLAKQGALPHTKVGNRHRFLLSDVSAFSAQMAGTRDRALAALAPVEGYVDGDF